MVSFEYAGVDFLKTVEPILIKFWEFFLEVVLFREILVLNRYLKNYSCSEFFNI